MRRRKFSREFKLEAVKLVRERGVSMAQAARDLDVHENVLRKWVREFGSDPGAGLSRPRADEARAAGDRAAAARGRQAQGGARHPKKGRGLLREGSDMKFGFIAKHRRIWPVAWICEALGVSRVGLPCLAEPLAQRQMPEATRAWRQQVNASFIASDRTYGARRVWQTCWPKASMRPASHRAADAPAGLAGAAAAAASAEGRRRSPDRDRAANILDRQFAAERPNQKWVADFTYIWTAEGWLYVAAVIDLFSRRVVGWSMSASMTAQLVTDALMMAIWRRGKPDALLHHSDQGSQYTSEQFQRLMADSGIVCSMSRSGNVWDNAAMESFFSSLKTERTARKIYRTRDEARADVFDYIERFYNADPTSLDDRLSQPR